MYHDKKRLVKDKQWREIDDTKEATHAVRDFEFKVRGCRHILLTGPRCRKDFTNRSPYCDRHLSFH